MGFWGGFVKEEVVLCATDELGWCVRGTSYILTTGRLVITGRGSRLAPFANAIKSRTAFNLN